MDGWKPIGYIELRNGVDGSIDRSKYVSVEEHERHVKS